MNLKDVSVVGYILYDTICIILKFLFAYISYNNNLILESASIKSNLHDSLLYGTVPTVLCAAIFKYIWYDKKYALFNRHLPPHLPPF